jgi:hypothetical protein
VTYFSRSTPSPPLVAAHRQPKRLLLGNDVQQADDCDQAHPQSLSPSDTRIECSGARAHGDSVHGRKAHRGIDAFPSNGGGQRYSTRFLDERLAGRVLLSFLRPSHSMVKEGSCAVLPGSVAMITASQIGSSGSTGRAFSTRNSEHL